MGILDHLWDDTVAGPRPDSGFGKLRKYAAYTFRSGSGNTKGSDEVTSDRRSFEEDGVRVSRSIMILKPPQGSQSQRDSPPASPAGSTPPASPFAGKDWLPINPSTAAMVPEQFSHSPVNVRFFGGAAGEGGGGKEAFRFRRRSASFAYEKAQRPRSPPPAYDV